LFVPDDEEALTSIMKDLAALRFCYQIKSNSSSNKPKSRTPSYRQVISHNASLRRRKECAKAVFSKATSPMVV